MGKLTQRGYCSQQKKKISHQPNSDHTRIHLRPRKYSRYGIYQCSGPIETQLLTVSVLGKANPRKIGSHGPWSDGALGPAQGCSSGACPDRCIYPAAGAHSRGSPNQRKTAPKRTCLGLSLGPSAFEADALKASGPH